ncbi:MAG TPA: hypothetical protein VMU07_00655 [Candidatus Paceibacterota bacterium]|nr:hypothetical protein [Candidatus Paceibacterota bacterium]
MVHDQLVDYIASQIKLGASRDAIKAALVGAGWQGGDVEDSFKKAEGGAVQPAAASSVLNTQAIGGGIAAKPISASGSAGTSANSFFSKPASAGQSMTGPQVIRMSDLVSSSEGPTMSANKPMSAAVSAGARPAAPVSNMGAMAAARPSSPKSKTKLIMIVGGILILGFGGAAGYFFMQNSSLSAQVNTLNGQSANVTSQVSSLSSQVNSLTASTTAQATQLAGLTSANQELLKELSFYTVPAGAVATSSQISLTGALGINNVNKMYFIIGSFGGKITISNSKDPKALTVLAPIVGTTTQFTGSYIPGTDSIIVTSVGSTTIQ